MAVWNDLVKSWERVTPPASPSSSLLAKAKSHCRLPSEADWTEDDDLIRDFIAAAISKVEEQAEVSLLTQTWRLDLQGLPTPIRCRSALDRTYASIRLERPTPPNTGGVPATVTSFKMLDFNYELADVNSDWYFVRGNTPPILYAKRELIGSAVCDRPDAYQVTFTAGNPQLDPSSRQAVCLLVAHWYRNRECVGSLPNQTHDIYLSFNSMVDRLRWRAYP